jgi:hypothetical protein
MGHFCFLPFHLHCCVTLPNSSWPRRRPQSTLRPRIVSDVVRVAVDCRNVDPIISAIANPTFPLPNTSMVAALSPQGAFIQNRPLVYSKRKRAASSHHFAAETPLLIPGAEYKPSTVGRGPRSLLSVPKYATIACTCNQGKLLYTARSESTMADEGVCPQMSALRAGG